MTSEIQNRITDLKAELDRLSFQLACVQSTATATGFRSAPATVPLTRDPVRPQAVRGDSLRALRDLMWQGRWGLAFHLARALEAQGMNEIDFSSSTIRLWTLASQSGRRRESESVRLVEELLQGTGASRDESLAPRLLEWATLIGLARGLEPSELEALNERFTPPEELPATGEWWRRYLAALVMEPRRTGKWAALPDQVAATGEVDELALRSEIEPIRLAASCLMMSIRSAMRYVQVLSTAEERFILNAELARSTSLKFTDDGEISSPAEEVEQAVCEIAQAAQTVMTQDIAATPEDRVSNVSGTVQHNETPADAQSASNGMEQTQESLESLAGDEQVGAPEGTMPTQQLRQSTARERLERYAERLGVEEAARLALVSNQLVVVSTEGASSEGPTAPSASEDRVAAAAEALVAAAEQPSSDEGAESLTAEARPVSATESPGDDIGLRQRGEAEMLKQVGATARANRRGIHEASLATVFGGETLRNATARPANRASAWSVLLTPQAAIIAGLLAIAGAVIVGLGTGLAAKDMMEIPAPLKEEAAATPGFAGDFPPMD
jgi:hypothetical protein